ncbi:MAG: type II secretion system F family protein [Candidatus Omnitrophica bacterium]|nr:type II secretion system F family protein [Candidatus Omnitrophota bacterium]MDD5774784.1 type II secretion system F family protein [Candidatus Omnitrophota bacterium]HNQ50637.1 type II secretion system F family protein [Candidatus Omnitrophota bacterium]
MARFMYIARDSQGKKVTGIEEGTSEEELIGRLQNMDLTVISIMSAGKVDLNKAMGEVSGRPRFALKRHLGVNANDLVLFCRQLATLLGSGVTILASLETIAKQVTSTRLYGVIKDLQKEMEQGLSFHETLEKHKDIFSELWINLVESGEASGNLAVVLDRLAMYLERNAEFRRKLISALIYPAILLAGSLGALLFLTIKIVPTFAEVFRGFNLDLPMPTQVLMTVSEFIRKFIILIIAAVIVAIYLFRKYIQTREGQRQWEHFLFKLPVFGDFFRALCVERFSSEMSTLVESGVPILYSLEITEKSVGSVILGEIVHQIKEDVRAGKSLSTPMEQSQFFEPMVVQMVTIGEEIGELSQMFKRINAFYQEYVGTFLTRILTLFEPIMLIFMGLVVGLMVVGMFLPIFQMTKIGGT